MNRDNIDFTGTGICCLCSADGKNLQKTVIGRFEQYTSCHVLMRENCIKLCGTKFEEEITNDFAELEDFVCHPFSIQNCLLEMKRIPDQKWLNAFCEQAHDQDAFARRQNFSRDDAAKLADRCPEMEEYVKLM